MQRNDKRRLFLGVLSEEVPDLIQVYYPEGGYNLSPALNQWMTLRVDLTHASVPPCGLRAFWTVDKSLRSGWRESSGVVARHLLKDHLWPSDYDDVQELLDLYPGHVVELTAFSRAVGVVPGRNTAIWEVRNY
jgi:hypothetical protein